MTIKKGYDYNKIMSIGEMAYVDADGALVTGKEAMAVMVTDEDDLTALAGEVNPGSIAFTAGFKQAWQLKADGTWEQWLGGSEES